MRAGILNGQRGGISSRVALRLLAVFAMATGAQVMAATPAPVASAVSTPVASVSDPPLVQTQQGPVQGVIRHGVLEFRGIPFGSDVSGENRWTLARPAPVREGVLYANSFQPPCAQAGRYGITEASNNENCLHLNISRPFMPGVPLEAQKRPVLVWIHGGSFVGGSASLYRLDRLAREADAVVVSVNYRLGVLGFMPHPDFEPRHNGGYALEDQRLAMRWVKENIEAFGGDVSNITLAGESAGGSSVCMHLLTPEHTEGLFHKAIIQSAACSFGLREVTSREAFGQQVGEAAGCADSSTRLQCMKQVDVQDLIAAADKVAGSDLMAMAPVYGNETVPRQSLDSLESGRFVRVPVLYGGTRDELRLWVGYAVQAGEQINAGNYLAKLREVYGDNAERVKKAYPAGHFQSAAAALGSVMSDFRPDNGINHCQYVDTAALLSRQVPVYFSEFADRNAPVLGVSMPASPVPDFELGAVHSAELNYFFPYFSNNSRLDAPDLPPASEALSQQLVATWASFIRTGIPGAPGLPAWEPFNNQRQGLRFAPGAIQPLSPAAEYQCDFWQSLYPQAFAGSKAK